VKKLLLILTFFIFVFCNIANANLIEFNHCYHDDPKYKSWEDFQLNNTTVAPSEDHIITIDIENSILVRTIIRDSKSIKKLDEVKSKIESASPHFKGALKDITNTKISQIIYDTISYSAGIVSALERDKIGKIFFKISEGKFDIQTKTSNKTYEISYKCEKKISDDNQNKSGSSGTAFFINSKGYLLTNNHVVEGCKLQKIKYKGKDYDANILATDKSLDLALMKVDVRPKNYLSFSKSTPEKLQKIYVAGYPFGKGLSDDLKISSGIVSSVKGYDDNSNEFQLDAAINPGNSGGPIVDDTGELIGIAVAGLAKDKSEGINFGIKSLSAVTFLKTNKIDPETSYMTFGMNNKKLLQLLEETTVYTYCN
jgi:S1-C subfamily serine protease